MPPVRAVLFDLDDTLFDHRETARAALMSVRDLHDCFTRVEAAELERSHARILEELHLDVLAGRVDLDAARIERFSRLYAWAGVRATPADASTAASAYRQRYLASRRAMHGAAELLAATRQRARVVVVSNNLLDEQQEKLRHCGLEGHVDVLVVSEEVGVSKPDRRIFDIALVRAGAHPGEAVMLGDSWANDIVGAQAAGIRSVWFSREAEPSPDPSVPMISRLEPADAVLQVLFGSPEPRTAPASARQR